MNKLNTDINLKDAINLYKNNEILIFDIRTVREWKMTGIIPRSILINMHDDNNQERESFASEVKVKLHKNKNKNIVFICASGSRSKIVSDYLIKQGYKNIYHIPDGILGKQNDGWLFQGYPITEYKE